MLPSLHSHSCSREAWEGQGQSQVGQAGLGRQPQLHQHHQQHQLQRMGQPEGCLEVQQALLLEGASLALV